MGKEAVAAAPQRAPKTSRGPERAAVTAAGSVHDTVSAVQQMQRTAGNAAVSEQIETGALDPRHGIAAHAVSETAGRPLDDSALRVMASYFQRDFSLVRVHDDPRSASSLEALGAEAYTVGNRIVAPNGALDVRSPRGRALLAHELTHTVQQSPGSRGAAETPAAENEAGDVASAATATNGAAHAPPISAGSAGEGVARQPTEAPKQSFHEVALQANRYWSSRLRGWPGDDTLRALWDAKKFDEFADAVRSYQRASTNAKGLKADGVVDQATIDALAAHPLAAAQSKVTGGGERPGALATGQAPSPEPSNARAARPAPVPLHRRFDGALGLLKEAKKESLAGNHEKAQRILQLIDEKFIATLDTSDGNLWKVFGNLNGLSQTQVRMLVARATGAVHSLRTWYKLGGAPSEGRWNYEIGSFQAGEEPLRVLAGDTKVEGAKNLQAYDRYSTIVLAGMAALIAIPLVIAGGAELGPAAMVYVRTSGLWMLALEHPVAAVDLTALAVGKTIQLVTTGEVSLTGEDLIVILYAGIPMYSRYKSNGVVVGSSGGRTSVRITNEEGEAPPAGGATRGSSRTSSAPVEEHESASAPPTSAKAPAPPAQEPEAGAPKAKPPTATPPPNVKTTATPAASKPMRAPPGKGARTTVTATSKTVTSAKPSNPQVTKMSKSSKSGDAEYSASPGDAPPAAARVRGDTKPFLNDALEKVSSPSHPLHKLVVETTTPGGQKSYAWRTTTFTSKAGKEVTGRFEGNEQGITVQVGHADAFASGAPERFMIEDADLNQHDGRTIESKGAFSSKSAVDVDGVIVELKSLLQWERLGEVPPGTAANAKKVY